MLWIRVGMVSNVCVNLCCVVTLTYIYQTDDVSSVLSCAVMISVNTLRETVAVFLREDQLDLAL